jgi:hypothetical protein
LKNGDNPFLKEFISFFLKKNLNLDFPEKKKKSGEAFLLAGANRNMYSIGQNSAARHIKREL